MLWGYEAGRDRIEFDGGWGDAERRKAVGECAGYPQSFGKTSMWKLVNKRL